MACGLENWKEPCEFIVGFQKTHNVKALELLMKRFTTNRISVAFSVITASHLNTKFCIEVNARLIDCIGFRAIYMAA